MSPASLHPVALGNVVLRTLVRPRFLVAGLALALAATLPLPASAATQTRTSAFTYDSTSGLLVKEIIEPDNSSLCLVTEYVYDPHGNKTSATTRNCNGSSSEATTPSGDPVIAPRTRTNVYAAGATWSAGQFPTTSTNALNQSESKTYDPRTGAVLTLTGPNGLTTTWTYDSFGRKTRETRSDGTQTQWEYLYCTGVNNGSASCPTIGGAAGAWVLVTTPLASDGTTQNGPINKTYYDGLNRELRKETQGFDGTGSSTAIYQDTQYDSLGRPYKKSRPYYTGQTAYWTTLTYDSLNRPIQETQADGSTTSTAYHGLTVTVTNAKSQTRTTVKNSQGQVVSVTDTNNQTLTYAYAPFGNLTRTTDALGNQTTLTYDLRGRKTGMQDPDMGTWSYAYNALGQLIRQTDAKAQVSTLTYDLLGRMTQRTEADLVSTWYYDSGKNSAACPKGIGKLCQVETDTGYNRSHNYDSLGRPGSTVVTVDDIPYTTTVAYDANGRVSTQSYPTGLTVKHGYTARGYLKDLRDNSNNALYWQADSQDAEGHLLNQTYGNGVQTAHSYTATNGRLTGILAGAGNSVQNFTYQYDSLGNITSREDANQSLAETFSYDDLNRMTGSTVNSSGAGIITKTYTFDALGNITSRDDLSLSAANNGYVYPASGASSVGPHALSRVNLLGGGHRAYTYDLNGNLTQSRQYTGAIADEQYRVAGGGRDAFFTSFNMPSVIYDDASANVKLDLSLYGPEHQRVKGVTTKTVNSVLVTRSTLYLNPDNSGGLSFEKETGFDGTLEERHFLTAGGQVVAVVKRTNSSTWSTRYFHRDNLGSTTAVTDETGAVVERLAYEPFGTRRFANGSDDPTHSIVALTTVRGFTNHEHLDELGLIHMNGRVYDPIVGRFMSADFVNQDPMDLQAYNRYAYVRNNPLMYTDPNGQFWGWIVAAVAEVAHQVGIIDKGTARTIQAVAIALELGPSGSFGSAGVAGSAGASTVVAGAAAGFVGSDFTAEGAIRGGISAALFYQVGSWTDGHGVNSDYFGTGNHLANIAGHAAVGCAMATAQGGRCSVGAASAGFGAAFTPLVPSGVPGLMITSAVSGTASVLGGGKFANGAVTGAFGYLFNFLSHASFDRNTGVLDVQDGDKRVTGQFFSGTGPDDQIASGRYAILDRGGKDGFRLEAIDSIIGDDMNGSGQSLLRLHGPGRSYGCVTACDGSNWEQVRNLIQGTAPREITVNTYKTFAPGGNLIFRWKTGTETLKYYGILEVK